MAFVNNQGVRLFWTEQGSGEPLLLVMGLSFTHEMWFRLVPELASRYRVILFDNRGMGRSDVPRGPYTIAQMASDACAVLDAAGEESAHVLGASMGGMIAQEMALSYPDRVRSLMLGCTSSGGFWANPPEFRHAPPGTWLVRSRPDRERSLSRLLYADTTPLEHIEEDLAVRLKCSWCYKGFFNQLAAILMWSSYRRLPQIEVPTLVVHGDQDRLLPPANGRVIADRIPGARFLLLKDAGHILVTDQPAACLDAIVGFMTEHSGRESRRLPEAVNSR